LYNYDCIFNRFQSLIFTVVVGDKQVKFEDKICRLYLLTREIETRKSRRNAAGAYWDVDKWKYEGGLPEDLMQEAADESDEDNQG
jgi:hypothetical protein